MSTSEEANEPNPTQFAGHRILTSSESGKNGTYGIAYCPICGDPEKSDDHGLGADLAVIVSINKIRTHMIRAHNVKREAGDS